MNNKTKNLIVFFNCSNAKTTLCILKERQQKQDFDDLCIGDFIPLENGDLIKIANLIPMINSTHEKYYKLLLDYIVKNKNDYFL